MKCCKAPLLDCRFKLERVQGKLKFHMVEYYRLSKISQETSVTYEF